MGCHTNWIRHAWSPDNYSHDFSACLTLIYRENNRYIIIFGTDMCGSQNMNANVWCFSKMFLQRHQEVCWFE